MHFSGQVGSWQGRERHWGMVVVAVDVYANVYVDFYVNVVWM
jgi:hypothetical protein